MATEDTERENYLLALGALTALVNSPDRTDGAVDYVNGILDDEGVEKFPLLVEGLLAVSVSLLTRLAQATGRTERSIVQELATRAAS